MILVVGGLNGFVGSNTTEALVERGADCVVTRHKDAEVPRFLEKYLDHHVFVEPADAVSMADLRKIGEKYAIDGIVNVAGSFNAGASSPVPNLEGYLEVLIGTFRMAAEWKVKRLIMSSTAGVYMGLGAGTVDEDQPLPLPSPYPLITYQKIVELAMSEFARRRGISSVCVRLAGMFGPWQDPSQGTLALRLVHAAVSGNAPSLEGVFLGGADDGVDLCYIKDVASAIARLQTAEKLSHTVYNVGAGRFTANRELLAAVEDVIPGFKADLPRGRSPFPGLPVLDTRRLQADTGFSPAFDIRSAVQDYVAWLRAGNAK